MSRKCGASECGDGRLARPAKRSEASYRSDFALVTQHSRAATERSEQAFQACVSAYRTSRLQPRITWPLPIQQPFLTLEIPHYQSDVYTK
jgi:hypothetical protein